MQTSQMALTMGPGRESFVSHLPNSLSVKLFGPCINSIDWVIRAKSREIFDPDLVLHAAAKLSFERHLKSLTPTYSLRAPFSLWVRLIGVNMYESQSARDYGRKTCLMFRLRRRYTSHWRDGTMVIQSPQSSMFQSAPFHFTARTMLLFSTS